MGITRTMKEIIIAPEGVFVIPLLPRAERKF